MIRIRADWRDYAGRPGTISNQRTISQFSVRADRSVSNDRACAQYLIEENIGEAHDFDLKAGFDLPGTFIDKHAHNRDVPSLQNVCKWAIGQDGKTIKEVFGGADFATRRGTMNKIASTLVAPAKSWKVTAQNFGGVILVTDLSEKYDGFEGTVAVYSGFKFEQYMTTSEPNGKPDTNSPVDNRTTFYNVVRSDLGVGGQTLKLCVAGELDALRGEEPIELKTCKNTFYLLRDVPKIIQSELVGVKRIVVGIKKETGDHILDKVVDMSLEEIKNNGNNRDLVAQSYSFLFRILSQIKNFLVDKDACRVSYDDYNGRVEIQRITRQRSRVDFGKEKGENGEFIADKLMMQFNL